MPKPGAKERPEDEEAGAKGALVTEDKLVGIWLVVKSEAGVPEGTTFEFKKNGKVKQTAGGKSMEVDFKIEGDKIIQSHEGKQLDADTVTKLTDTEMITKDKKNKLTEFKKK
jgi:uncharacterized protein (TIGR03066 family)